MNTQTAEVWTEPERERAVVDDATLLGRLRRRAGLLRRTQPLLAAAIEEIIEAEAARPKSIPRDVGSRDCVLWAVERAAAACYVTREAVLSSCRTKNAVRARALAIALCRARYGWSWPELGRAFRIDHTSAGAALKRARRDPTWALVEDEERRGRGG